jgi:hypothetical protein
MTNNTSSYFLSDNYKKTIDEAMVYVKLLHHDAKNGSREVKNYIYSLIERAKNINVNIQLESGITSPTATSTSSFQPTICNHSDPTDVMIHER